MLTKLYSIANMKHTSLHLQNFEFDARLNAHFIYHVQKPKKLTLNAAIIPIVLHVSMVPVSQKFIDLWK